MTTSFSHCIENSYEFLLLQNLIRIKKRMNDFLSCFFWSDGKTGFLNSHGLPNYHDIHGVSFVKEFTCGEFSGTTWSFQPPKLVIIGTIADFFLSFSLHF